MNKMSTRMLVEAGILIALAQVLSFIKYELPYGGSVTPGSMIPIIIFAIRWGSAKGILAGLVYGFLQFALGTKFSYHPLGIFLDYIFAYGCLGLAGLYRSRLRNILISISIALFSRFSFHYLSGIILWRAYAEDMNPYLYSLLYNGSYMLPELIISVLLVSILYKPLKRYFYEINKL